jgi:hypothetical protein
MMWTMRLRLTAPRPRAIHPDRYDVLGRDVCSGTQRLCGRLRLGALWHIYRRPVLEVHSIEGAGYKAVYHDEAGHLLGGYTITGALVQETN